MYRGVPRDYTHSSPRQSARYIWGHIVHHPKLGGPCFAHAWYNHRSESTLWKIQRAKHISTLCFPWTSSSSATIAHSAFNLHVWADCVHWWTELWRHLLRIQGDLQHTWAIYSQCNNRHNCCSHQRIKKKSMWHWYHKQKKLILPADIKEKNE